MKLHTLQGIPADEIFKDDFDIDDNDVMGDDITTGHHHGDQEEEGEPDDEIVQSRKRRRFEGDASDQEIASDLGTLQNFDLWSSMIFLEFHFS